MADVHGLGIDLYAMTSLLWKSNQEHTARIKELESENAFLKGQLDDILKRLSVLEAKGPLTE